MTSDGRQIDWAAGAWATPTPPLGLTVRDLTEVPVVPPPVADQRCRLCGAPRRRAEPDDAWVQDVPLRFEPHDARVLRDDRGRVIGTEVDEPAWSRRHTACVPTAAFVVSAITGVEVDQDLAMSALAAFGPALAGDLDRTARRPWGHLTTAEVEGLRAAVVRAAVAADPAPTRCRDGRCGCCGRSRSTAWTRAGVFWSSDGLTAPLCASCERMVPDTDGVVDLDRLRLHGLAEFAGLEPALGLRAHGTFGFRLAAEVLAPDQRHDEAEPWTYNPDALAEVRREVRTLRPHLIRDPTQRAIGVRVLDARRARAVQEDAKRRAAETPGGRARW